MALISVDLTHRTSGTASQSQPSVGSDSMTFKFTFTGSSALNSNSLNVSSGSIVFACVAMGDLAAVHAPSDSAGNTYSALLPPHNYVNWSGSGQRLYAATNVTGGSNLVVTETMPDPNDEVTLSVLEVRGGTSITHAVASETAGSGPTTSGSVTTSGPAVLASWWWGDGAVTQHTATPSAGWTKLHALSFSQAENGVIQVELAARAVSSAGTYSCTWTSDVDQGAVVYIAAVQ